MSREQDYITKVRQLNRRLWGSVSGLAAMQREWQALDYGTALDDGAGENDGLTAVEVGAVVFDTANAFIGVMNAGHATNMAKLL